MQKAKFIGALVGAVVGFRGGSLWNVFFYAWLGAWLGGLLSRRLSRRPAARATRPARPAETPRTRALRTLGLPPTATREQAHAAYRTLARKHHPDTLRAAGADAETVARATKTMARLNAAWDVLKG